MRATAHASFHQCQQLHSHFKEMFVKVFFSFDLFLLDEKCILLGI